MNQEQVAKVLAGHWSASTHTDRKPFVDKCDGCGAVILTWGGDGDAYGVDGSTLLAAHQAEALAPLFAAAKAEAWDRGMGDMVKLTAAGPGYEMGNPYRTT